MMACAQASAEFSRMDEWMEAKQVAAMYAVDEATVYRWIQRGVLPAKRLAGQRYRIRREDARALLADVEPSILPSSETVRRREIEAAVEELRRRGHRIE